MSGFDVGRVRADFPQLARLIHDKPLVYLDSANTAQKPQVVIDAVSSYYREHNANVYRAVHTLSDEATTLFEAARDAIQRLLNAGDRREIVLTRGTTEAINLVAQCFARPRLDAHSSIVITHMEHHANIVPWQMVCAATGAKLKVAPITPTGELDLDALFALLTPEVKLLAFTHISNALGTVNPVAQIVAEARKRGIATLIDGSQAVAHTQVDVRALGCDFYVFTGHKLFGPTGTGALYGKREHLNEMPPYMGGGEMIDVVTFDKTTFAEAPIKFEAGTPNIAGFIGLAQAIGYVEQLGYDAISAYEAELCRYAQAALTSISGLRLIGDAVERIGVFSFLIEGAHAHDLATILDHDGIALRSGHHCAHPLMAYFGVAATVRASLSIYNTVAEVDHLVASLERAKRMLQ